MLQKLYTALFSILAVTATYSTASAQCGNGQIDGSEECDDNNIVSGDGCSTTCVTEEGFACFTQDFLPVVNPSFESRTTGWEIGGTVDVVSAPCFPPGEGARAIDLNGSSRGQLSQGFDTTIGTRYVVTFLGNANCREVAADSCGLTCTKIATVSAATELIPTAPFATTSYVLAGGPQTTDWASVRFEFVAVSTRTLLQFTGSDPSFAGPMIDRVAIAESVCGEVTCGNGAIDAGEACDDGNNASGDGCASNCGTVERGWMCETAGSPCVNTCGDGIVAGEACDDGDLDAGDGCSPDCRIEPGYTCITDPFDLLSICALTCGDGNLDPGEACDDGNDSNDDACSDTCRRTPGEACTAGAECTTNACVGSICGCEDTSSAATTEDRGCAAAAPVCDVSTAACVECLTTADCTAGFTCEMNVCQEGMDAGMDAGTDAGSDAGSDAGMDAGMDAGPGMDAAVETDAGTDSGPGMDVGTPDSDSGIDSGTATPGVSGGGCSASGGGSYPWAMMSFGLAMLFLRRRRS